MGNLVDDLNRLLNYKSSEPATTQPSDRARNAAAGLRSLTTNTRGILEGLLDDHPSVQAFATFERETFAAGVEAAAKCAEAVKCEYMINAGEREMRERIITAIRNLTPAPPASEFIAESAKKSEGLDTDALVEVVARAIEDACHEGSAFIGTRYYSHLARAALSTIRPSLDAERAKWQGEVADWLETEWLDSTPSECANAIRSGAYRSDERG